MTSAISQTGLEKYYKTGKVFSLLFLNREIPPGLIYLEESCPPGLKGHPPTGATNAPTFHTFPHTTWQTVYT